MFRLNRWSCRARSTWVLLLVFAVPVVVLPFGSPASAVTLERVDRDIGWAETRDVVGIPFVFSDDTVVGPTGFGPWSDQVSFAFGPFLTSAMLSAIQSSEVTQDVATGTLSATGTSTVGALIGVTDPGFSSTATGFAVSTFSMLFTVDAPATVVIDLVLSSDAFQFFIFGSGRGFSQQEASFELCGANQGCLHSDLIEDAGVDGFPLTSGFTMVETLAPDLYRFLIKSNSGVAITENGLASSIAGFGFQLAVVPIPAPSAPFLQPAALGILAALAFGRSRSKPT